MPTLSYPTSLPQFPVLENYNELWGDEVQRTPMERGPDYIRRVSNFEPIEFSFSQIMTNAQVNDLKVFYDSTKTGSFYHVHFRNGESAEYRFKERPKISTIPNSDLFRIEMLLELINYITPVTWDIDGGYPDSTQTIFWDGGNANTTYFQYLIDGGTP